ncbi:cupin domain-containing protein [Paenibacillus tuaregi]|uniref:cupin domain-containing protein n=1 Tax=Paenibacillus tuaregi TaxID=1816681 RepID=UPI000AB5A8A1|nr:cupin domain-containing protein [Paenibacillus tuaregi]
MISYMDFTSPSVQYAYDLRNNLMFKKDDQNFINALSIHQLNTLGNVSLLDIYLSQSNVVEPHTHQNASELVYCISGAAVVSLINPFTKQLINIPISPGQVANVPQGWWHYEIATVDHTHLLAIFDAPVPEFIGGSDLLRLTPASVLAHTYCLDSRLVADVLAPITDTVVIGPPANCSPAASDQRDHVQRDHMQRNHVQRNHVQSEVRAPVQDNSAQGNHSQDGEGYPPAYLPQQYIGNGWRYPGL